MFLDTDLVISEVVAPKNLVGKKLTELDLRRTFGITVIALKSSKSGLVKQAGPDDIIEAGDVLISASSKEAVRRLVDKEG
jgi:Trk K+ transport system NAD-binding subunit